MKRKQLFRTVLIYLLLLLLTCGCSAKIVGQGTEVAKSEESETAVSADISAEFIGGIHLVWAGLHI